MNKKIKFFKKHIANTLCRIISLITILSIISLKLVSFADMITLDFQLFGMDIKITKEGGYSDIDDLIEKNTKE